MSKERCNAENELPLGAARGILVELLMAVPFWVIILLLIWVSLL